MYDVCCDNNKYTFPVRCQDQVEDLKQCTRTAVADPALIRAVAAEYLLERVGHVTRDTCIRLLICRMMFQSHYRHTGIKTRRFQSGIFAPRPPDNGPALDPKGVYRWVT